MDNVNNQAAQLVKSINELTDKIENLIQENQIETIDDLLSLRHQAVTQLVDLHSVAISTIELQQFLKTLRERDKKIIQDLQRQSVAMKSNLQGIDKIKQYTQI